MKKLALIAFVLATVTSVNAQEIENIYVNNKRIAGDQQQTIFGGPFSVRGFFELTTEVTTIRNQTAVMVGGGADVVLNHKLNIGFVGQGTVAEIKSPNLSNDGENNNYINFGYGGIKIEPVIGSFKKLHLTVPMLIGGGAIIETDFNIWDEIDYHNHEDHHLNHNLQRTDAVFVFQPGLNAELNLFKHARLALGAKYRFVNDVDISNLNNQDFEGLSGNISLRFGWF